MKTKIAYVVVSDEKDIYLEQTLISIYSLCLYNPNVTIILVVDDITDATINGKRSEILKFISEKKVVNLSAKCDKLHRSRYLKTTLREHIEGDYLYLDSDTIITSSLNEIDKFDGEIGAVKNHHMNIKEFCEAKFVNDCAKKINWILTENDKEYYNSGVFYVKDTINTRRFYKEWNRTWKNSVEKGIPYDQPALGKANSICNYLIKELDGTWNCQILDNGLAFLFEAKIIHYFTSAKSDKNGEAPYVFLDNSIYNEMKQIGEIPNSVISHIKHAKSAFNLACKIYSGHELMFLSSGVYLRLKNLFFNYPFIFRFVDRLSFGMGRIAGIINRLRMMNVS